jgi:hypothetical protein
MTELSSSIADRFEWLLRVACERASRHELAVAVALAAHVNSRTGTAWPSARTIADLAGLDLRHAWGALRRLHEAGLVHIADPGGPARSATYTLAGNEGTGGRGAPAGVERASAGVEALHGDATQRRTWVQQNTELP